MGSVRIRYFQIGEKPIPKNVEGIHVHVLQCVTCMLQVMYLVLLAGLKFIFTPKRFQIS